MSRELIVLSLEAWDEVWRRNQYLIDGLLRGDPTLRVLFVEPSNDVLHSALSGRGIRRGTGLRSAAGYEGRLSLFQPDKVFPRVLGPMADAFLHRAVRHVARRLGFESPVVWINDPGWAGLARGTGWPSIYDMTDDWLAADRPARELRRISRNEDTLMDRCEAVVVCSEGLRETRRLRREVVLIPNAVDVRRYRDRSARPDDLPDRAAVYVGTLHEDRLDVDLVLATADEAISAGGRVALVGPSALSAANTARLTAHPGVAMLGSRPYTAVPAYLQHAAALIVPHVVNDFTDSLDPLKLYEYLAVGRPIVSTPVAGFRSLAADEVIIAEGREFPEVVSATVREDLPTTFAPGVPDWADRVAAFSDVLAPLWRR
ncbi:glycosyltransferase [Microbacterium sp. CPCC 204701]|uniref:glycosyltransferase n=1 Tax=Microbacterium sp. CPCC 204701 TaxID=2493084 RepID=UPI000FDB52D7|nr:glycosyltransferase [Microbacterium sp. CPCC 204701]